MPLEVSIAILHKLALEVGTWVLLVSSFKFGIVTNDRFWYSLVFIGFHESHTLLHLMNWYYDIYSGSALFLTPVHRHITGLTIHCTIHTYLSWKQSSNCKSYHSSISSLSYKILRWIFIYMVNNLSNIYLMFYFILNDILLDHLDLFP